MRFECQKGCTACCRQKGFVYLSELDSARMAEHLGMSPSDFERRYVYRTTNLRRLRVPRETQCAFLEEGGCSIYEARPTQCRTFPYWPELVASKREWQKTSAWCPGIGKGPLVRIEAAREAAVEMRAALPSLYP